MPFLQPKNSWELTFVLRLKTLSHHCGPEKKSFFSWSQMYVELGLLTTFERFRYPRTLKKFLKVKNRFNYAFNLLTDFSSFRFVRRPHSTYSTIWGKSFGGQEKNLFLIFRRHLDENFWQKIASQIHSWLYSWFKIWSTVIKSLSELSL